MDVQSICRTCLGMSGPFLSIYAGDGDCKLSEKLRYFTKIKAKCNDLLPEKVCLTCIGEINRCYTFALKCDNSNSTLRQLIPEALPEEKENVPKNVATTHQGIQTELKKFREISVQTDTPRVAQPKVINEVPVGMTTRKRTAEAEKPKAKKARIEECNVMELEDGMKIFVEVDMNDDASSSKVNLAKGNEDTASYYELTDFQNAEDYVEQVDQMDSIEYISDEPAGQQKEVIEVEDDANIDSETDELSWKCPSCSMTFANLHNLRRHQTKFHDKAPAKTRVLRVSKEKDEGGTETEEFEELEVDQVDEQNLEEKSVTPISVVDADVAGKHRCDMCNALFASKTSLGHHRKTKACLTKTYKCNKCQRVFISEESLQEHRQSECERFPCKACSKTFNTQAESADHMIEVHNRKSKYQCTTCEKVFTMMSALKDHMRVHSGEKPFECPLCTKAFSQKSNLRQHMSRHSDDKKFKCAKCPSCFVTKAELQSHSRSHTQQRLFECNMCPNSYTAKSSLIKHKRKHTGERPYKCEHCPMVFTTLNILKNHRRTHTGEKPFKCQYCNKGFAQSGDCHIHEFIHTGEKNYACQGCGLEFARPTLARHHLRAHPECKTIMHKRENISYTITGIDDVIDQSDQENVEEHEEEGEEDEEAEGSQQQDEEEHDEENNEEADVSIEQYIKESAE